MPVIMNDSSPKLVNCPTCGEKVTWSQANAHRPFCSERCKLIDFGEWAQERHTIPGEPVYPELDEPEDPLQ